MSISHDPACDLGYDCVCPAGDILFDPEYTPIDEEELFGRWVLCDHCENPWCLAHEMHAFECACPSVDEVIRDDDPPAATVIMEHYPKPEGG